MSSSPATIGFDHPTIIPPSLQDDDEDDEVDAVAD